MLLMADSDHLCQQWVNNLMMMKVINNGKVFATLEYFTNNG